MTWLPLWPWGLEPRTGPAQPHCPGLWKVLPGPHSHQGRAGSEVTLATLADLQTAARAVHFTHNEKALPEISIKAPRLRAVRICDVYISGGYKSFSNGARGLQGRLLVINGLFPLCLSQQAVQGFLARVWDAVRGSRWAPDAPSRAFCMADYCCL